MEPQKVENAEDWFELGKYHSSFKNSRNAIECYQRCVKKEHDHFKAWANMAAEYFKLKNFDRSIECCKEALKIKRNDNHSWLTLAANYFELNENGKSLFCFDRAKLYGNKKAEKFLSKARDLKDNLMDSEIIDVSTEIFGVKQKGSIIDEIQKDVKNRTKSWRYYKPKLPKQDTKDYHEKLEEFLLELGDDLIIDNGGVISIIELFAYIKEKYLDYKGTLKDLFKALKELEKKGLIVGIKKLPESNLKIVEFVPSELTKDIKKILDLAVETGTLTYEEISMKKQKWDEFRIMRTMNLLESKKIARKTESFRKGIQWFFPGVITDENGEKV